MPRSTKIVATLGPASSDAETLGRLIAAGVDVVRLNFSHGTAQDHIDRATLVRKIAAEHKRAVAILADLQGPKIRVGKFAEGKVQLEKGATFVLDADCELGNIDVVGIDYKELPHDVKVGDVLLLDDGKIVLTVDKVLGNRVSTTVKVGGVLSNNKGINKQGGGLTAPPLTSKDIEDINTSVALGADYLAVSFPKSGSDMYMARELMRARGGKSLLIAKIERAEAIPALEEILKASDGIMVARGDLAVEVGDAAVPALQKRMIRMAREMNKLSITATQMMESMITSPVPTRAEVSDVANAVLDGTEVPGGGSRCDAPHLRRNRQVDGHRGQAGPGLPQPGVHAHRPIHRDGGAVHCAPPQGKSHRRTHAVRFHCVVDEPPEFRRADLRPYAGSRHL